MKTFTIHLLLLICLLSKANDTLTFAQIYSFNIGDTFEYRHSREDIDIGMPPTFNYERWVLLQKTLSPNFDTIYLGYAQPNGVVSKWEVITDLDSFAILKVPTDNSCNNWYSIDSTTYAGYITNRLQIACFESGQTTAYTEGLGKTNTGWGQVGNSGYGTVSESWELIYYSNGSTHVGTPYSPPPPYPTKYIPLPETCAVWTSRVTGSYTGNPPYGTITEQIRTGNQIHKDGKIYVELICRIQNGITNHYTPDSLVGYFYNDSVNRCAIFTADTNAAEYMLCSFTGQPNQQCSANGYFYLDSVLLGGIYRTYWHCSGNYDCSDEKISGIGNLSGLIKINHVKSVSGHETCGDLISFCVCGNNIYSNNTTTSCDLLSDIPQPIASHKELVVYPNPAKGLVTLTGDNIADAILTITNINGAVMLKSKIDKNPFQINMAEFAQGLYFIAVTYPDGWQVTNKITIEK